MDKTVAIVNEYGSLADTQGRNRETSGRYAKFAKRLISSDVPIASLDYGWNGATQLLIGKNGAVGEKITLNAESVVIPGSLRVSGKDLDDIINSCTDLAIRGICATEGQTTVTITENPQESSSEGEIPRLSCKIGLSQLLLDRITTVEETLKDLFRFSEVYTVGDGLKVLRESKNRLTVKLGFGLKFEDPETPEDTKAITLVLDPSPVKDSPNPVTSGGVYDAIQRGGGGGSAGKFQVGIDPNSGNMMLYEREDTSSSDSSESSSSNDSSQSSS